MNWFKKVFGKRNWKMIHTEKCSCLVMLDLFGIKTFNATIVLLYDDERKDCVCYIDYNDTKKYVNIDYILPRTTEMKFIIDKYNIIF